MENSTISQDNGPREVCHAFNFEFKVAPSKVQFANYVMVLITNIFAIFACLGVNVLTILFFIGLSHFISSAYIYTKIFLVGIMMEKETY